MKVLVTGATGYIGNYVVRKLLDLNHEVVATGIETSIDHIPWKSEVEYIQFDNSKRVDLNLYNFFNKPDKLIHLAWSGLPNYNELFHYEENLFNDYSFLKNLIINGLCDVCITGTCFEYGMNEGVLKETQLSDPQNPYALAKDTLRKFLQQLQKHHQFCFKWIRLFYMHGEGQNKKSILSQLKSSIHNGDEVFNMSKGEQLRDYLPVENVAANVVNIALQNKIEGIVNCCSGNPISIRTLVENEVDRLNTKIRLNLGYYPYPDYEAMAFWGDSTKLKSTIKKEIMTNE